MTEETIKTIRENLPELERKEKLELVVEGRFHNYSINVYPCENFTRVQFYDGVNWEIFHVDVSGGAVKILFHQTKGGSLEFNQYPLPAEYIKHAYVLFEGFLKKIGDLRRLPGCRPAKQGTVK